MNFTHDQQQVIDFRGGNLLVSAAAGSGKTAVLVERIIAMITEKKHPIDIDRLLIVTFTNAAASEMRERIGLAIEHTLEKDPSNEHLMKQLTYIHKAQITTIHSFCLSVIRSHFNLLNIDPNFRISEEAELNLIKSDVLSNVLEEKYIEKKEDFLFFVESYSVGKSDKAIEDLILHLYEFSRSYPRPKVWLQKALDAFSVDTEEGLNSSGFMESFLSQTRLILTQLKEQLDLAMLICQEEKGPIQYMKTLEADKMLLDQLCEGTDFTQYQQAFMNGSFTRLSGKAAKDSDESKRIMVKDIRDQVKGKVVELKDKFFRVPALEILTDIQKVKPAMKALVEVTLAFSDAFLEAKGDKNLVDFSDLEHFALKLLISGYKEDETPIPSSVALELSEFFEEILIDEYQDSNLIQEAILNSISKAHKGVNNVFMVGDVKQSIYKFRLARPDLFIGKYNQYPYDGTDERKIELRQNFRSRASVLHSINYLFYQLMGEDLGDITYTKEVALDPGMTFSESEYLTGGKTELLIADLSVDAQIEEGADIDDAGTESGKKEIEAGMIAQRIHQLLDDENPQYVVDKGIGEYRRASYRDIVILLRTVSGWAEVLEEVLLNEGIPAHCDSQKGYFGAIEIQTILSLLSITDNVYLDIPMAAVLRSPMGGFTGEELAYLKNKYYSSNIEYNNLYTFLNLYQADEETGDLFDKTNRMLQLLEQLRDAKTYLSLHDLIWLALNKTNYYHYVGAMPQGKRRQANILMLIEKGKQYESTSYKGLFHFIRYIDQLKEYDMDFGEAKVLGDGEDLVRIMSIHKSKGLEFPIVFVSGMAKKFNQMDAVSRIVIHPSYYLGPDCINPDLRSKKSTLMKNVIAKNIVLETLGEELRILYVALTRAKEKLIMTAAVEDLDKLKEKLSYVRYQKGELLDYNTRTNAKSYLEWILAATIRPQDLINEIVKPVGHIVVAKVAQVMEKDRQKEELLTWTANSEYHDKRQQIEDQFYWEYPFKKVIGEKGKYSVSEIKKLGQDIDDKDTQSLISQESVPIYPRFMQESEVILAVNKGTAVHKVLQLLPFDQIYKENDITLCVLQMINQQVIGEEYKGVIPYKAIARMLTSPLGKRMRKAASDNLLYKEVQYVMGLPINEMVLGSESDELVLIQGIIDVYFEEDGELVIVDYKTDYVKKGEENLLIDRYKTQLSYYEKALETITGKRVKEKYMYSFGCNKEILV